MGLSIRLATLADVALLERWDKEAHVIENRGEDPLPDWRTEIGEYAAWQQVYIACVDDRPIGVVIVMKISRDIHDYWREKDEGIMGLDIWIGEKDCLGKGYGSEMMRQVVAICFSDPSIHSIYVDPLQANSRAHRFYERLGFMFLRNQRFNQDDCVVYSLRRGSVNT